ncbi:MAG: STAS domain-containing protein [Ignavibacterium sp.]|nr:MAG: STAS domain-containing protein [Ignavibacterium sp.]
MENFEILEVEDVYVIVAHLICPTYLEANDFKEIINLQVGLGHKKLVVDISLCEHIDSTFIGAIIKSFKQVTSVGGALKIVKPVDSEVDIFILTKTLNVFDLYNSREDAIKSFENDSQPKD